MRSIVVAGGVSASQALREKVVQAFQNSCTKVYFPERKFSGDNAAMVGAAVFYEIEMGVEPTDPYMLNIAPRTPIG